MSNEEFKCTFSIPKRWHSVRWPVFIFGFGCDCAEKYEKVEINSKVQSPTGKTFLGENNKLILNIKFSLFYYSFGSISFQYNFPPKIEKKRKAPTLALAYSQTERWWRRWVGRMNAPKMVFMRWALYTCINIDKGKRNVMKWMQRISCQVGQKAKNKF